MFDDEEIIRSVSLRIHKEKKFLVSVIFNLHKGGNKGSIFYFKLI